MSTEPSRDGPVIMFFSLSSHMCFVQHPRSSRMPYARFQQGTRACSVVPFCVSRKHLSRILSLAGPSCVFLGYSSSFPPPHVLYLLRTAGVGHLKGFGVFFRAARQALYLEKGRRRRCRKERCRRVGGGGRKIVVLSQTTPAPFSGTECR